jgi:cytochrome c553
MSSVTTFKTATLCAIVLLAATVAALAGEPAPDDALLETGRRIYHDGILPGGEPLRALRPEGFVLEGSYAACVTCHRRSGMGSVEGSIDSTILVPPVAGPVLFVPARFAGLYLNPVHHYVPNAAWERALTRPAYDLASLARALREGLDPGGKQLVTPMPRYELDDAAVAALAAYLRQLSSVPAPGVEPDTMHLATVVTPEVRPGHVNAVLDVVRRWSESARGGGKAWRLQVWELAGPSDTWSEQLETRYRQQPVFALLSGVGGSEWAPVHRFCEQHRVPCVLPSVEMAPDPANDYYSMYFSPGLSLEARVLARYLADQDAVEGSAVNIVQVYSDASGRQAADVLRSRLNAATGSMTVHKYRLTAPRAAFDGLSGDDLLILWLRPDEIAQLVAELPKGPAAERVFVSALLATPEALDLPAAWKARVHYVSLFDDPGLQGEIARLRLERWLELADLAGHGSRRLQADAYAACYLFNDALGEIREQEVRRPAVPLSREHLLETLETLVSKYDDSTDLVDPDSHVAFYGRMSLGPRQRVAVRGGTIMRYASPDSSRLVAASKRIVP